TRPCAGSSRDGTRGWAVRRRRTVARWRSSWATWPSLSPATADAAECSRRRRCVRAHSVHDGGEGADLFEADARVHPQGHLVVVIGVQAHRRMSLVAGALDDRGHSGRAESLVPHFGVDPYSLDLDDAAGADADIGLEQDLFVLFG